jgi:gluconokinase
VIVVVAGVSGSGKSTIGALLADRMRLSSKMVDVPIDHHRWRSMAPSTTSGGCTTGGGDSGGGTTRGGTTSGGGSGSGTTRGGGDSVWEFIDGDELHPAANVAKMRAGVPLTDADRVPWLAAIGAWMDERIAAGTCAVVACSALRRAYRATLLDSRPQARLVFLRIDPSTATARLAARHGHFFPATLLDSQFRALEPPGDGEHALIVDASRPAEELAAEIAASLRAGQWP